MKQLTCLLLVTLYFINCSCKTAQVHNAVPARPATAITPGTCNIKGSIVSVIEPSATDTADICSRYPCRARIKIIEVFGCGAAVSLPVNAGDTIEMKFAYTLHNTDIFPAMKAHFPGLKKGDVFVAAVQQRLVMGAAGEFVVYDYEVK